MTQETKSALKHNAWKYLGSMFMEEKNGTQAVSLHRVLALVAFIACMILWFWADENRNVPDSLLYTLWGLLGINGAHKVITPFTNKSGSTTPSPVSRNHAAGHDIK